MSKPGLVRLSAEQMNALYKLQEQERSRSVLGTAPSINALARAVVAKGLEVSQQVINHGRLV